VATLDRLERLTDLVLVLLAANRPLTLEEIAREVPGFPESKDARRQAFERDKRLLREDGIPVRTEPIEGHEQFGYRIDPDAFYLPELELSSEERLALNLAVAGVHLGDPSGRQALLKLGSAGVNDARPVASLVPPTALVPLYDAMRSHAEVSFGYRGEARVVAPAGLWFRNGHWYFVGFDRRREAGRTFRVDRIDGPPEVATAGSGVLPDGFDVSGASPEEPARPGEGHDEDLLVLVDHIEGPRVREEVGDAAVVERREDGSVLLRLGVSSTGALRSWVLGLLDHAEVVGPPAARADFVAWLESVALPAPLDGTEKRFEPALERAHESEEDASGWARPEGRDASARLQRLLAIVGWLARVGEAPLSEVAARFSIPEAEVVKELELAACCGLPPYSPDVLLEIVVTDDSVRAFLPSELARPRRLTAAEGFALAASARTILAVPGADEDGALARALMKLEAALGDHAELVVDIDQPSRLSEVRRATESGERLRIEYHSASSDETTQRDVDPVTVSSLDGHWYLDAFCHRAQGLRRFRVDRIRSLEVIGTSARPPTDETKLAAGAFVPGPGASTVQVALDAEGAWVADSVPVLSVVGGADGTMTVTMAVGGRAWLERLLLQLGPHARVLGPPEFVGTAAAAARRVLQRYGRNQKD